MSRGDLISIILPVFNGEKYLEEAIQSCLEQTYKNFELIIVNDASTDSSLSIAESYLKKDRRIQIVHNSKNKGLPASLNIGHQNAKGEYYTWTSDDNLLKPDFLLSLYTRLKDNNFDVIFSDFDIISDDDQIKRNHSAGPIDHILFGNSIGASFLYSREVYENLGGYNENLFLVEDHDFFLRAAFRFKFHHFEKNLYKYRIHQNTLTNQIQNKPKTQKKYFGALEKMYSGLEIHNSTQLLLIGLFLKNPVLDIFLKNKKIIIEDLKLIQEKLKNNNNNSKNILPHFEYLLRLNWIENRDFHSLKILVQVLTTNPELLFRKVHNRNASLRIIYNSLKIG